MSKQVESKKAKGKTKIVVHCSHQKMVAIGKLKPNPANPNKHPDSQVDLLVNLITTHGWRHPITVSNRSGLVVAGHCRLLAAAKIGLKQVPVDEQDFASDAEELAVLVADNRIPEMAEIEGLKMADILCELDQANYPLELTALDESEIKSYILGPSGRDNKIEYPDEMYAVVVECESEEQQKEFYEEQLAKGRKCRLMTL